MKLLNRHLDTLDLIDVNMDNISSLLDEDINTNFRHKVELIYKCAD